MDLARIMNILVFNAGSSSLKCALYQATQTLETMDGATPAWYATAEKYSNGQHTLLNVRTRSHSLETKRTGRPWHRWLEDIVGALFSGKTKVLNNYGDIAVIGHRVVHGGRFYTQPVYIDSAVKSNIKGLSALAPQHNPIQLAGVELMEKLAPDVPQIAVFDTAFHTTIPAYARIYPIPYEWYERGICRYGFHGISHESCAYRTARILGTSIEELNIISCHIGHGVSLAAIQGGICIDTTMGFSPLEGVMMGSRSGSIDPAILIYLMQNYAMEPESLATMLRSQSGLKGVSGISSDVREIHRAIEKGHERARLALEMYVYRLRLAFGAMLSALGRIDALVFTAGVGENDPIVREKMCEGLGYTGIELDREKNNRSLKERDISSASSEVRILILPAQENLAIAQKCWDMLEDDL